LSNGQVLVADRGENRIALIDMAGQLSTPVSRTGDGPGEYRGVGWLLALGRDSSLFIDPAARRWIVFDGARAVQTIPSYHAIFRNTGLMLAGADGLGRVLGIVGIAFDSTAPPMRESADSLALVLARRFSTIGDTIARMAGRGSAGMCLRTRGTPRKGAAAGPCNRLKTEDLAVLFVDGWTAIARADPYRVDWRDPAGRWTNGARIPEERATLSHEDKCDFLGS
jgi:hypothetical protein